jgi:hypothetical protein
MGDTGTRRPTSEEVEQAKEELKTEIHLPTHRAGLIYCSCGHDAFESIYKFSLHRVAVFERIAFVLLAEIEGSR